MRDYELTVLLNPELAEKAVDGCVKSIGEAIEKLGGKVKSKKDAEKKTLAYKIEHFKEAFYVYFELSLDPANVLGVEGKIKLTEGVIRYLFVKSDGE